MRTSEWIQIGFAVVLALAAWLTTFTPRPLPWRRRWIVTGLAVAAGIVVALAVATAHLLPPVAESILRDWLTVPLFLVPYWQTGQFFLGPDQRIQQRLLAFDRWLLPKIAATSGTSRSTAGFLLEMAYLFCYPLVPLGLTAIYAAGLRQHVAEFWFVVLVSTYLCYAITPFVPAYPPRALMGDQVPVANPGDASEQTNPGRVFNRWILRHGSIHAISFPSAHVASALSVALVLLRYAPWIGAIFLLIAIAISLGAVIGRYHYALDVLAGALAALVVFFASYEHL